MESRIASALHLETNPVALLWSDECPQDSLRFKTGRWGCVMMHVAQVAARGRTAAFDRETYGCWGGGVGLGFGNCYRDFPGGEEVFCGFLSTGNRGNPRGEAVAEQLRPHVTREFHEELVEGERYLASPALVRDFIDRLPMMDIPARYVVFHPLGAVDTERETPVSVTFFAPPDQLSALVVLANHGSAGGDRVALPWGAACQQIGILAYRGGEQAPQRAVVGLTDLSARKSTRAHLGSGTLSFTVPFAMFLEMEQAVEGSFLERATWAHLLERRQG
ncbi:MAG: DUF169 domain-containing protein [Acidobacteria bacterium]|nr:DUF169 domain-containing protein [Acidobacteriota bacterium]